jgi:hypothetical protein
MKFVQWIARRLGLQPRQQTAPWKTRDAMPPALARTLATKANDRYQQLYSRYHRGELPRWANHEFEQFLLQMGNHLQKLESEILAGRKGGRPSQREKDLERLPKFLGLKDEAAADKAGLAKRTYQRRKQEYRATHIHIHNGFGGPDDT